MGNAASQLPYSIDQQVGAPQDHHGWALHQGKSTDGNETPVSVFVGKKPQLAKQPVNPRYNNVQKTQLIPALHHYNQCRKLRHPHILKVLATLDTDNPTAASQDGGKVADSSNNSNTNTNTNTNTTKTTTTGDLIIVTEPCVSLDQWLFSSTSPRPEPEQIAWGLECVVQGLHFLHASAQLAHGNISPSSFYVTRSGDVKLWNFSLVTPIGPNHIGGPSNHFREWEQAMTPEAYRSPERVQLNYEAMSQAGVHAMDSYALAVLIDHWFQGQIPAPLQKAVQRLQTPSLKMRPRLQPLLKCPIFDTPYQKLQTQLEEIILQPIDQKVQLWQNLALSLQAGLIPKDLALYKILPLIQSSIQSTCTNETLMAQDLYRREVLAMIAPMFYIIENFVEPSKVSKALGSLVALLFLVKDRGVRGALLGKVDFMSQHLDKNTLNSSVYEPLCSGFNDSSPALRELTLKATLSLVSHLTAPNMEKLSRYLVRLQSDTETSIRTNAVKFIAKIAPSLSDISREKMLLPAYARSMKDPFAPCRLSALQSLKKSQELFSKQELAGRVLPAITPLLLDPMENVRKEAFGVVNGLLRVLEQESDRLTHLAQRQAAAQPHQPPPPAASASGVPSTSPAPPAMASAPSHSHPAVANPPKVAPPAPASSGYLSGLSSWMSTSAQPDTTPTAPGGSRATAAPPPHRPAPPLPMAHTTTMNTHLAPTVTSTTMAADDGWGDEDDNGGWGDEDDDDGLDAVEDDPFANIGTKTTTTSSTSRIGSTVAQSSPTVGFGRMSIDDDDDPFAAIGMKPATAFGARPKGKLILPSNKKLTTTTTTTAIKLKPVAVAAAAPATKIKLDASEMGDGWDDF